MEEGWRKDGGRMEEGWRKDGGRMEGGWWEDGEKMEGVRKGFLIKNRFILCSGEVQRIFIL